MTRSETGRGWWMRKTGRGESDIKGEADMNEQMR